jgi:hypothetical protein
VCQLSEAICSDLGFLGCWRWHLSCFAKDNMSLRIRPAFPLLLIALATACGGGGGTGPAQDGASGSDGASGGMVDASFDGASLDGALTPDGRTMGSGPDASTSGLDASGPNDMFRSIEWDAAPACDDASCSALGTFCQSPRSQIGVTTPTLEECTDGGWIVS